MIMVWAGAALWAYAYAGYPMLLLLAPRRRSSTVRIPDRDLPTVSVSLPVYNESAAIAETLDRILASDYPKDRLQVLVISDASTDGTDDIVRTYADRGVWLMRMPDRVGKTAAENAGRGRLSGEIVINTDASVRVDPAAIRLLVEALADPEVGVASARDVSVGSRAAHGTSGEGAYVGYEMWVRDLETRAGGIVGASGCLYAIRAPLHQVALPDELSRDFGAALTARRHGFRAVSVRDAICFVPRAQRIRQEYKRKVRTMARGLRTLRHFRALLDPSQYGGFAWKLWSHKLVRWLLPWATLGIAGGVLAAVVGSDWSTLALTIVGLGVLVSLLGVLWPSRRGAPRWLMLGTYAATAMLAGLHAWWVAFTAPSLARWEPTRRNSESTEHRAQSTGLSKS